MSLFQRSPFLSLLHSELKGDLFKLFAMATISGFANAGVVVIINASSGSTKNGLISIRLMLMFLCLLGIEIFTKMRMISDAGVALEGIVHRIRLRVSDKLRRAELEALEQLNSADIQFRLNQGLTEIGSAAFTVFPMMSGVIMLMFTALYIAWLSPLTLLALLVVNAGGAAYYIHSQSFVMATREGALTAERRFYSILNQVLSGFKEVKINRRRSEDLFSGHLVVLSDEVLTQKTRGTSILAQNAIAPQLSNYLLLGAIVFILPTFESITDKTVAHLTAAFLFTIGPISSLVMGIFQIGQLDFATTSLRKLEDSLVPHDPDEGALNAVRLKAVQTMDTICLEQVGFRYEDARGNVKFQIGPIDLAVKKGEILFIVGGNGSGKSTFLKVFCGLYPNHSGKISLNGVDIDRNNTALYRGFFSVIFTDFHLFDSLYGLNNVDPVQVAELLREFGLEAKTALVDGHFTNIDLSTGQRKRLALIVGMLENKQLYILDEVAADQDPAFRAYFYEVLLGRLRSQGKTLIVVSHDDKYFHVADRVMRMDYGKLIPYETGKQFSE